MTILALIFLIVMLVAVICSSLGFFIDDENLNDTVVAIGVGLYILDFVGAVIVFIILCIKDLLA